MQLDGPVTRVCTYALVDIQFALVFSDEGFLLAERADDGETSQCFCELGVDGTLRNAVQSLQLA